MTTFIVLGLVGLAVLAIGLLLGDVLDFVDDLIPGDTSTTAVIGAFVAATGFGGESAEAAGASVGWAWPVGIGIGVLFGLFAAWLTKVIRGDGRDGAVASEDALGRDGRVVTDIPEGGFGVVNVLVGGSTIRLNARSDVPLQQGAEVHVTSVISPTAVVVGPGRRPLA